MTPSHALRLPAVIVVDVGDFPPALRARRRSVVAFAGSLEFRISDCGFRILCMPT